MTKLPQQTQNLTAQSIEKLLELFPQCETEMLDTENSTPQQPVYKKAVNFELLKQLLSESLVDDREHYEFTWVGKKSAIIEANTPIRKTLRPCPEESVNWDTTENLYIEGDNLDVLKMLLNGYYNRVKMIYIDPPYNTGSDSFIYPDDFTMDKAEYEEAIGLRDHNGNKRLATNKDSNPRFHSDWCSMMYSRLMLARKLLADDGVIFISIDDNEQGNLKKICDEVFGVGNFIATFTVIVKTEGRRYGGVAKTHEFVLAYSKNIELIELNEIEVDGKKFQYEDANGGFNVQELRNQNARAFNSTNRPNLRYPFYVDLDKADKHGFCPVSLEYTSGLTEVYPITINGYESVWRWGKKEKATKFLSDLVARRGTDNVIRVYQKMRKLTEMPKTVLIDKQYISIKGTREIQDLIGLGVFDFPKPVNLLKLFLTIATKSDDIILDFFSGSATTAHAVMQLNAEDGGNRKFIMVQLQEPCPEKSEAYKAGYKNICEIGKERIRRAGKKILEEAGLAASKLDVGFRVLKADTTNMKDVYYKPDELKQEDLTDMVSNIEDGRTNLDLLFGCMLDWGLPLSLPYTKEVIDGCTIFICQLGDTPDLVACFDTNITEQVVVRIARLSPLRVVFRDKCFSDSPDKINVFETFKTNDPKQRDDVMSIIRVI